jgi:ABC-type multidrug transport system permease subunit
MPYPFFQLFFAHLKMLYRNKTALFWNFAMPSGLYIALSVLPLPNMINLPYKDFVLPGMIAYVIMSNGIYGLAYWMAEMRSKNVIKRFIASPIKISDLVLSLVASRVVIMIFQTLFLSMLGIVLFDFQFNGNIFTILLLIILGGGIFLLMGLLIANFSSSYETATPLTTAVGMPMIFFGNVFFPAESLPKGLYLVSKILPISHLAIGLRQSYIQPIGFTELVVPLSILSAWLIGLLIVVIKIFKLKE